VTRLRRIILVTITVMAVAVVTTPSTGVGATAPPTTTSAAQPSSGPPSTDQPTATNDLLPENNDLANCIGTVESANCGSRARADGHTYLVFLALTLGLTFIGWRIARGVRARDTAHQSLP
jgi:hypothetical protein